MRAGQVSITAARVAALRLGFPRVETTYGDPAADVALSRDIIGDHEVDDSTRMAAYLRARTAFFDRAAVRAVDAGVTQIVVVAAGYDGRSLRYAKPGVRWFEIDHPGTQGDKLERLGRLGINAAEIAFLPVDFTLGGVAEPLLAAGFDAEAPSLVLCEGLAVYLELSDLRTLLAGLRSVAAADSILAISLSVASGSPTLSEAREQFRASVAAVGEPARTTLTVDESAGLLAETGWCAITSADPEAPVNRAARAGLVTARPV